MSKDEALIKGTLDIVLKYAYPDTYKQYLSYFVRIRPKELKSKHAHYIRKERMIEIFNLSRESRFLLITCLHEVAHHVEFEDLNSSGHEQSFFDRLLKLYLTAVGLKLLDIQDISDETDAYDYRGLLSFCGGMDTWEVPTITDIQKRMVIVKNGRNFKEVLKSNGFHWFTVSQTWQKEMGNLQEAESLVDELSQYAPPDTFLIRPVLSPTFLSYYYIGIENGYEYRYGLKELGYLWEGYGVKKMWVKKVDAQGYYEELAKLTNLQGLNLKKLILPKCQKKRSKKRFRRKIKRKTMSLIITFRREICGNYYKRFSKKKNHLQN